MQKQNKQDTFRKLIQKQVRFELKREETGYTQKPNLHKEMEYSQTGDNMGHLTTSVRLAQLPAVALLKYQLQLLTDPASQVDTYLGEIS